MTMMERPEVALATHARAGLSDPMERADAILGALSHPVLVLDEKLSAVTANLAFCRAMQLEPEECAGASVEQLFAFDRAEHPLRTLLESVVRGAGSLEDVEFVYARHRRKLTVFLVSAHPLPRTEGLPRLLLLELRDVTTEREREHRIREMNAALQKHAMDLDAINKELEAFTHSVSHDLRTPLRLTSKIAHLLLQEYGSLLPDEAALKLRLIIESTREMAKLIEDLLTFSKVSREPLKKRNVDMRRLAREVIDELVADAPGRDIEAVVEDLPSCRVDRALMKQVLLNLIGNALKFTRSQTTTHITVGCVVLDGENVYYVRDNGVGFRMEDAPFLFLPFHRLHKEGRFEGSGLGLALVQRVIGRHGGRIWAESEVDHGSTFYFTLGTLAGEGQPEPTRTHTG